MRVDCHQSVGLIWSATAAEDAPRFLLLCRKFVKGIGYLFSRDFVRQIFAEVTTIAVWLKPETRTNGGGLDNVDDI